MTINYLTTRYKQLVHDLHGIEKTIISIRGDLKWGATAPANIFEEYDGAVDERSHIEEEIYELSLQIRQQKDLDHRSGEMNKVIPFPKRYVERAKRALI